MNYCDMHFHLDLHKDLLIADKIEANQIYTIAVTNTPSVFFHTEKIAVGKKAGLFARTLGTALQFGVTSLVAKNKANEEKVGHKNGSLLHRIFSKSRS